MLLSYILHLQGFDEGTTMYAGWQEQHLCKFGTCQNSSLHLRGLILG